MVLPSISFRDPVVHLDKNTIRFLNNYTEASVYTVNGRVTVRLRPGKFQQSLLAGFMTEELAGTSKEDRLYKLGECNLVWKSGIKGTPSGLELHIAIEKKLKEVSLDNLSLNQVMGVDVGENNAAALSTGRIFKAGKMKDDRDKYLSSRARFQRNGSKSAKQALRKASGREKRHVEQINDEISKSIIEDAAERNIRLLVLEDLTDIHKRIKTGQKVRARLHRVDPCFTSKTCPHCNAIGTRHKHRFVCNNCGYRAHSDLNGGRNLQRLGCLLITRGLV